jgi:hypothetical protein
MNKKVTKTLTYYKELAPLYGMIEQAKVIEALVHLGTLLTPDNEDLQAATNRTYIENNWLTNENYALSITHWSATLSKDNLQKFVLPYPYTDTPQRVGVIMAGNIPLVGFHDLLCVLLSGHHAVIKPSSDDKYVMLYIVKVLTASGLGARLSIVERLDKIGAVIATGSNTSFRYFELYFKHIPSLLRKNRKSLAILSGNESSEELDALADDVFQYFGLGCRNVSLLLMPREMDITRVLDHFMKYKELANHNKYANNYTYHRALLLMNQEQHLDTGFALPKERMSLHAPLACIHYAHYDNPTEIAEFLAENQEDIQCIVGNYSSVANVALGSAQMPDLQDFADGTDTMSFLCNF